MRPVKYLFYSRIHTLSIPRYVHVIRVLLYFVYWIHMISWMGGCMIWSSAVYSETIGFEEHPEWTNEWVSDEQAK